MLSYLTELEYIWGPFRLFGYLTLRCIFAMTTAMIISFCLAPWLFGQLRTLKMAQKVRDKKVFGRLADIHAKKSETPSMGGVLIYIAITLSVVLWARLNTYVYVALFIYTGLSCIGFWDDYLKITQKNAKGLASYWKLAGQGFLTLIAIGILLANPETHLQVSELWVPLYKYPLIKTMPILFIFIFFFFIMAGTSNAINLTDGIDGLAIGCTIPVAMVYMIIAYAAGNTIIANYLYMSYVPGIEELAIICAAIAGASLAFLWYNCHPAEIFMGDTGSLSLGGLIGTVAFLVHEPITLILIGGVFVMEALSVILQVISFKCFGGRRIFLMAPIHHHFELKNWHESKVVVRFWILSLLFALAGLSTLKLR